METVLKVVGLAVIGIAVFILASLLWSVVIWLAWNGVMPFLFHLPTINIIQAFCLSLLGNLVKSSTVASSK